MSADRPRTMTVIVGRRRHQGGLLAVLRGTVRMMPVGLALSCSPAVLDSARVAPTPVVAGAYQVSVCAGPCTPDAGNRLASGLLILTEEPFGLLVMSEAARRHLERHEEASLIVLREFGREPNACFVLERRQGAQTLAGTSPAGISEWRAKDDGIAVRLWVSPDAGYVAELRAVGDRWEGKAFSWHMSSPYQETTETITATRTGPPDLAPCLRAIEAEAARRSSSRP